jgi:hypothetical protein
MKTSEPELPLPEWLESYCQRGAVITLGAGYVFASNLTQSAVNDLWRHTGQVMMALSTPGEFYSDGALSCQIHDQSVGLVKLRGEFKGPMRTQESLVQLHSSDGERQWRTSKRGLKNTLTVG